MQSAKPSQTFSSQSEWKDLYSFSTRNTAQITQSVLTNTTFDAVNNMNGQVLLDKVSQLKIVANKFLVTKNNILRLRVEQEVEQIWTSYVLPGA